MRGDAGRKLWRRQVALPAPPPPPGSLLGSGGGAGRGDEVTVEHLIVGVLLFTPLLALMPTTAVWYLSLALAHAGVAAARLGAYRLAGALQCDAAYTAAKRLLAPGLFPAGVVVQPLRWQEGGTVEERGGAQCCALEAQPRPLAAVLLRCWQQLAPRRPGLVWAAARGELFGFRF
jgi:hypothetical protein